MLEVQGRKVEFLHRTVRDFLRTVEMRDFIASKALENFDPSISIFGAYVAWIKHRSFFRSSNSVKQEFGPQEHLVPILDESLSYASKGSTSISTTTFDLIDDLEWFINLMFGSLGRYIDSQDTNFRSLLITLFRQRLVRASLANYIAMKLNEDSTFLDGLKVPPLAIVLRLKRSLELDACQDWSNQRLKLLHDLLVIGHDSNEFFSQVVTQKTPWSAFVAQLLRKELEAEEECPIDEVSSELLIALDKGVLSLLLEYGANPNVTFRSKFSGYFRTDIQTDSIPVWAKYFVLIFSVLRISDHTDAYIQVLDKLLSRADFEISGEGFHILFSDLGLTLPPSEVKELAVTARTAVFQIISSSLRQISSATTVSRDHTYPYFQLLSKAIGVFLSRAAHPSIPITQIKSYIREIFPPSLAKYLLDVIRSSYSGENIKSKCRKRANVLDKDSVESFKRAKAISRNSKR